MSGYTKPCEQEYVVRINFCPFNIKKVKHQKFGKFSSFLLFFLKYGSLLFTLCVRYLHKGTVL